MLLVPAPKAPVHAEMSMAQMYSRDTCRVSLGADVSEQGSHLLNSSPGVDIGPRVAHASK